MTEKLFSTFKLGRTELSNRIVMAPMTRSRCPGNVPGDLVVEYYRQRATAGLIITEGTAPAANGLGYPRIPGIFSDAQVEGWKRVTQGVHELGGHIYVQLMHTGRVGHHANMASDARLLGPSAIAAPGEMFTDSDGPQPHPVPEVMSESDIEAALESFVHASKRAIEAGFDGVELHGANGYLIDQFLNVASNQRDDDWGKTIEGRARFAIEAARRASKAIGADRVGIRLSPYGAFNGMTPDDDMDPLFLHLAKALAEVGVVYVHLVDHSAMGAPKPKPELMVGIREAFGGTIVLSGGYDGARAEADLQANKGELVAFGRPFLSNPDLPRRLREGLDLAEPDMTTLYTPGDKGYTDYSTSA